MEQLRWDRKATEAEIGRCWRALERLRRESGDPREIELREAEMEYAQRKATVRALGTLPALAATKPFTLSILQHPVDVQFALATQYQVAARRTFRDMNNILAMQGRVARLAVLSTSPRISIAERMAKLLTFVGTGLFYSAVQPVIAILLLRLSSFIRDCRKVIDSEAPKTGK
jgi:hypothetical protein